MCQLDAQMQLTPLLPAAQPPSGPHIKRRKTSTAAFFAESDESEEDSEEEEEAVKDELEAYLVLPQVKCATEQEVLNWWRDHADEFPNLAVMARCPVLGLSCVLGCSGTPLFPGWHRFFRKAQECRGSHPATPHVCSLQLALHVKIQCNTYNFPAHEKIYSV